MKRKKRTVATTLALARKIASAASEIKAVDLKILDLRKVATFADFFVIASGSSNRHVEAIAESIVKEMKKDGRSPLGIEGVDHARWIVVDYGDVVAHIFYHATRLIYAIEKLWGDARVVKIKSK